MWMPRLVGVHFINHFVGSIMHALTRIKLNHVGACTHVKGAIHVASCIQRLLKESFVPNKPPLF